MALTNILQKETIMVLTILLVLSLRFTYASDIKTIDASDNTHIDANEKTNSVEKAETITLAANYHARRTGPPTSTDLIVDDSVDAGIEPRTLIFCGSIMWILSVAAKRKIQKRYLEIQGKSLSGMPLISLNKAKSSV
jgi:hypothetical protein